MYVTISGHAVRTVQHTSEEDEELNAQTPCDPHMRSELPRALIP